MVQFLVHCIKQKQIRTKLPVVHSKRIRQWQDTCKSHCTTVQQRVFFFKISHSGSRSVAISAVAITQRYRLCTIDEKSSIEISSVKILCEILNIKILCEIATSYLALLNWVPIYVSWSLFIYSILWRISSCSLHSVWLRNLGHSCPYEPHACVWHPFPVLSLLISTQTIEIMPRRLDLPPIL